MKLADSRRRITCVLEGHKATTLGASGPRLKHHVGVQNRADRLEVVLQVLPRHVPAEVAHVHRGAAPTSTATTTHGPRRLCGIWGRAAGGTGRHPRRLSGWLDVRTTATATIRRRVYVIKAHVKSRSHPCACRAPQLPSGESLSSPRPLGRLQCGRRDWRRVASPT